MTIVSQRPGCKRSREAEVRFGGLAEASFLTALGRAAFLVCSKSSSNHYRCREHKIKSVIRQISDLVAGLWCVRSGDDEAGWSTIRHVPPWRQGRSTHGSALWHSRPYDPGAQWQRNDAGGTLTQTDPAPRHGVEWQASSSSQRSP